MVLSTVRRGSHCALKSASALSLGTAPQPASGSFGNSHTVMESRELDVALFSETIVKLRNLELLSIPVSRQNPLPVALPDLVRQLEDEIRAWALAKAGGEPTRAAEILGEPPRAAEILGERTRGSGGKKQS